MAEKKKETPSPRFEVKKRQPKEKPNFFQNIPSFKHPLAEILNFPAGTESSTPESFGTQNLDYQSTETDPLQSKNFEHSNSENLDTQKLGDLGTQDNLNLNTQKAIALNTQTNHNLSVQKLDDLSTQTNKIDALKSSEVEHPIHKVLSAKAPKFKEHALKSEEHLSAQTPKAKPVEHSKEARWRKYNAARSTVRVNLHIDKNIDRRVRQYCMVDADPKVELKEFFERAALHFLDYLGTQNNGSLSAQAPLDDRRLKMLYKTKPFIINLYLAYNSIFNELAESGGKKWTARWSPRDDESAVRYNDMPAAIIELGILQTQVQKGFGSSRIQTFKYYTDEIEKVLSSGASDEMLATILSYHRQLWKNQTNREVDLSFLDSEK